jgi:predicted nucleic acid-binding protein
MSSERFVLDTNVIVSAVLSPRSIPRQAFVRSDYCDIQRAELGFYTFC